jgi:CubicO group peptidase (beta-lactamase class C family)
VRRALGRAGIANALAYDVALTTCIATRVEKRRRLPGDKIVPEPMFTVTHAITIDAPIERVWPWLAQMGSDRAGWYSWDAIDNGAQPSALSIVSDLQAVAPGDVMPAVPGAKDAFIVAAVDPPHDLVLTAPDGSGGEAVSWEHFLESLDGERTRLILRARVSSRLLDRSRANPPDGHRRIFIERVYALLARLPRPLLIGFAGFGHRIMEARHLRGIQRRAERTHVAETPGRDERSQTMSDRPAGFPKVQGHVSPGFEAVREAFVENFARRRELGGACCAYVHGEKVVDLWGGIRNKQTGEPWERDTMVLVYSATKGLSAMTLALAHSRGWLDYEERVATYWPEFAQHGKEKITVRQLLAHQAGLFAFDEPVDRSVVADLDRLAVVLARQKAAWESGTRQAYHAITLGFYEGELLRRVDPRHRSLGQFFQDEIATPLGEDVYVRLPAEIPTSRLATLATPSPFKMLLDFPIHLTLDGMNRHSNIYRALITNPGFAIAHDEQRVYARNLEVPSGGAVGTARAIAHAYGDFAAGGQELGLRRETLDLLAAPAIPPARGFYDECMKGELQFSLGFMKPSPAWPFGPARARSGLLGLEVLSASPIRRPALDTRT